MKTVALILAGMVAMAMASCPNQCSGHGSCGDDDKCECYKQTGTTWRQRVGWSGADCSVRTCPLGVAFDTLQTNRGVEIEPVKFALGKSFSGTTNTLGSSSFVLVKAINYQLGESKNFQVRFSAVSDANTDYTWDSADYVQYQWKLDTHTAFSAPAYFSNPTTGLACTLTAPCELTNNEGTTSTGIYIYTTSSQDAIMGGGSATNARLEAGNEYSFGYDYQEGRAYEYGQSNLAHQEVECSGRGSCDGSSGRCACENGYTGEACQRTTCPNDCSGHGVCQDLRRFAADFSAASTAHSLTYDSAWDARKQMGCVCDNGFRGPDCSLVECPSGADPMGGHGGNGNDQDGTAGDAQDCSGRGLCDYSSGQCDCFKGFYGERCEYQTNFV